ncbi:hypothetical protein OCK74_03620 [Chitinophagaceae bacterium LB-8]|uniref:HD domain-containing protein n=1 Tax=Paraflavisolibacter caeni TaxID=2982496 RepID=A0A9X3BF39_9BACT|nr:HD domain-containing protein [Paraflavisolibacter caeni]MCU7548184.1 hypothetical protein [Paraflavisolibacter caeni]
MNYQVFVARASNYIRTYMKDHRNENFIYHNLNHTESVVSAVTEISKHYRLNKKDFFICTIAAWFHDSGYYEDILNHELIGAKKAEEFLIINGLDERTIDAVRKCILGTKMPQAPASLLEQILCDADLYNLGTDKFPILNQLVRKEIEAINHTHISKEKWCNSTICLLENHNYHTDYCKKQLNIKKFQNMLEITKMARSTISTSFSKFYKFEVLGI